jgi:hypothetical protein
VGEGPASEHDHIDLPQADPRRFREEAARRNERPELERWVKAVSSHSIRVGVAQDNLAAGESLPAIMQAYRWRDPKTVMRYGARLAAKSGRRRARAALSGEPLSDGQDQCDRTIKPERRRRVLDRSRSRNSPRAAWRKGKNSISSVR